MDSTAEFAQLQLRLVDQTQWRYEVIRPLVLFADRTATHAPTKPPRIPIRSGRSTGASASRGW